MPERGTAEECVPLKWSVTTARPRLAHRVAPATRLVGAGVTLPEFWLKGNVLHLLPSLSMLYGYIIIMVTLFLTAIFPPGVAISRNDVYCYRASRLEHHVVVHVPIGDTIVNTLLLFETTEANSVRLFKHQVGASATIKCTYDNAESICRDKTIVDTRQGSKYGVLEFRLHSHRLELYNPSTAYYLGLDGDLRLQMNTAYWVSESLFCWAPTTLPTPTVEDAHVPLQVVAGALFASVADFAGIEALEATPNHLYKESCNNNESIRLFPHTSAREAHWLGLVEAADKLDLSSAALDRRRIVVEVGETCANQLELARIGATLTSHSLDCAGGSCTSLPSLPMRRLANQELVLSLSNTSAHMTVQSTALDIQSLQSEEIQLSWGVARVMLIIITASILYVRAGSPSTDTLEILRVHIAVYKRSRGDAVEERAVDTAHVVSSSLVGLTSLALRAAVLAWRLPALWRDDFSRLVLAQVVSLATSCSLWVARLVRAFYDETKSVTMQYGGSTAVLDLLLAVILAYSSPPLLTNNPSFDATARLLVTLILTSVSVPRIVVGLVATTIESMHTLSPALGGGLHGAAVLAAATGWVLQILCMATTVGDCFAFPFSRQVTRATAEDPSGIAIFFGLAAICTGLPTLSTISCCLVDCA